MKVLLFYIAKRLIVLLLTLVVLSLAVYASQEINAEGVAVKALGPYSTVEQRRQWLVENGYNRPFIIRYGQWINDFVHGDWGYSFRYKRDVSEVLLPRLKNTAILAGTVMLLLTPLAILGGVIAGVRNGRLSDHIISFSAILSTSIPEFAAAALFSSVFVLWLDWLPGTSAMTYGFDFTELILPVMVLVFYSWGYITRITRAAVIEVWNSPYIRTAQLKGLSTKRVIFIHVLKNALTTPITVLLLQFPWLLSGVLVVEYFFAYKGFGVLLLESALYQDVFLLEACAVVAAVVVVCTQFIGDVLYAVLNPKYRLI